MPVSRILGLACLNPENNCARRDAVGVRRRMPRSFYICILRVEPFD
jgi:hypothetical protein